MYSNFVLFEHKSQGYTDLKYIGTQTTANSKKFYRRGTHNLYVQ